MCRRDASAEKAMKLSNACIHSICTDSSERCTDSHVSFFSPCVPKCRHAEVMAEMGGSHGYRTAQKPQLHPRYLEERDSRVHAVLTGTPWVVCLLIPLFVYDHGVPPE